MVLVRQSLDHTPQIARFLVEAVLDNVVLPLREFSLMVLDWVLLLSEPRRSASLAAYVWFLFPLMQPAKIYHLDAFVIMEKGLQVDHLGGW